jgi:hypothetical protein
MADMKGMIWGYLVHLSFNMWSDRVGRHSYDPVNLRLQFDDGLWDEIVRRMKEIGVNMVVIDLGDGVQYESHPEIVVKGAWSRKRLREELKRLRGLGIEPIPKMNFSTCHDAWLGPYSRRVSTPEYYRACRDLIAEAIRLFDRPRFFHLGMDEETARHQSSFRYVVVRQHDLWWNDFHFLRRQVQKAGVRPWIWSDYVWDHANEFWKEMPRSVLQSNWYYGHSFSEKIKDVNAYRALEAKGYDQIPAGTFYEAEWADYDSFPRTVRYVSPWIPRPRLKGFLQTSWVPTAMKHRAKHMGALEKLAEGVEAWSRMKRH